MLGRLFADPLAVKELSGVSRRWQTYLGRVVYLGIVAFVLYSFIDTFTAYNRLASYSEYARIGRQLFGVFVAFQMFFVTIYGISAASDMVTKEVRAGTLGLLAITPLSPWRIALGKWKAAMAMAGTVVLSGIPVVAICFYLGGVGAFELAWSLSLSAGCAALSTAVTLYFSSLFRHGYVAAIVSMTALLAYTIIPALIALAADVFSSDWIFEFFCFIHPGYAATYALAGRSSTPHLEFSWIVAAGVSFAIAVVLLRLAARRIRVLTTAVQGPSVMSRTFAAMDRFYESVNPKRYKDVRFFSAGENVWESNAMLWKELRTSASGKLRYATRIGLALLLLVVAPLTWALSGSGGWHVIVFWLAASLYLMTAIATGVSLFVTEKEERKWDVLLSTPLTPREIIRAKLLGGLAALTPLGIVLFLIFGLLSWGYGIGPLGGFMTAAAMGLTLALAYVLGAAASLRARSLRGAFTFTFAAVCALLVLLPLFLEFLGSLPGYRWGRDDSPLVLIAWTNPAVFLVPFSEAGFGWGWRSAGAREEYDKLVAHFVVYAIFHVGAIWAILLRMKIRFNAVTGRS